MNLDELKKIAVFQALDDAALTRLAGALEERECADGQTIFAEGDPGDAMFFIGTGAVRIEKETGADASGRKTLAVLGAGDYFGESVALRPEAALGVGGGLGTHAATAAVPRRLRRPSQGRQPGGHERPVRHDPDFGRAHPPSERAGDRV